MELHSQIAIDFSSSQAQIKLRHIEELIKEVYKNQQVSKKDLEIRDQVINRIKESFFKASHKDYPIKITGEILISGFGSCHNGSWNTEKSDIDVTAVFFDSLTHNHHQLIKMCSKIIAKVARKGTLTYVPASRVPILKFIEDISGIQVDFNVNNLLGIKNSNLIFTYTQIDQRFHIMNVFLKWWAKSVGIIGAAFGYLSSYALTLMIIAFL
jgi:DNA polymerase sigma